MLSNILFTGMNTFKNQLNSKNSRFNNGKQEFHKEVKLMSQNHYFSLKEEVKKKVCCIVLLIHNPEFSFCENVDKNYKY